MPQLYQNVTLFDEWNPLIVKPLYSKYQISYAVDYLKFGGAVIIPGEPPVYYYNIFPVANNVENIYELLVKDPSTFFIVYSSHIFGVLDWDIIDSYIHDYYPLNRIPASFLVYSTWFFVIWGIIESRFFFTRNSFLIKTSIISAILYLAFIATTLVEIRYGYPIFLLLLPFSGYGIKYFYDFCIKHDKNKTSNLWNKRIAFISIYLLFISTFFYVSFAFASATSIPIDWFEYLNLELFH